MDNRRLRFDFAGFWRWSCTEDVCMTYPFKFSEFGEPALTFGRRREWGPLAATEVHAEPGRYPGTVMPDHRVIFYLTPSVPTDCCCEGVQQRRIGAPADFD